MAAGLGFKDFTTGEVLTAADVDGYLMQGVWVFASATARDAAVTSPQEGNFAYLKDTNVTTYYTGSAWANLDTTGMTNPMTTTGDTIYSSSGSTPARLGIGSTGQVLTVAGGVPSWATPAGGGGMTLLSTTTLSGSSTTISLSGTYKNLECHMYGIDFSNAGQLIIKPNNDALKCDYIVMRQLSNTNGLGGDTNQNIDTYGIDNLASGNANNAMTLQISNYQSSTNYKPFNWFGGYRTNSATNAAFSLAGIFKSNTAITSLVFAPSTGTFSAGEVKVYGVN
jgi:hypothetical protein